LKDNRAAAAKEGVSLRMERSFIRWNTGESNHRHTVSLPWLAWIRNYSGDEWYLALEPIKNPRYLDDLRAHIAGMIEKILRSASR